MPTTIPFSKEPYFVEVLSNAFKDLSRRLSGNFDLQVFAFGIMASNNVGKVFCLEPDLYPGLEDCFPSHGSVEIRFTVAKL